MSHAHPLPTDDLINNLVVPQPPASKRSKTKGAFYGVLAAVFSLSVAQLVSVQLPSATPNSPQVAGISDEVGLRMVSDEAADAVYHFSAPSAERDQAVLGAMIDEYGQQFEGITCWNKVFQTGKGLAWIDSCKGAPFTASQVCVEGSVSLTETEQINYQSYLKSSYKLPAECY